MELRVTPPAAAPGVNGRRRQLPWPVPRQQLPPALFSPARMRRHTVPRAIKSPQRTGEGPPPLLSLIDRPIKGRDAWAPAWDPAGRPGATCGRRGNGGARGLLGEAWRPPGGHVGGPSGEASRPPIDPPGLGAIDRSNLQEFMVSMWG